MKITYNESIHIVDIAPAIAWHDGSVFCLMQPDPSAMYSDRGVFRDGLWGFVNRYDILPDGTYDVDYHEPITT